MLNLMECTAPSTKTLCMAPWQEPKYKPQSVLPEKGFGGCGAPLWLLLQNAIASLSHPSGQPWSSLHPEMPCRAGALRCFSPIKMTFDVPLRILLIFEVIRLADADG